jgi:hypothetical protein
MPVRGGAFIQLATPPGFELAAARGCRRALLAVANRPQLTVTEAGRAARMRTLAYRRAPEIKNYTLTQSIVSENQAFL